MSQEKNSRLQGKTEEILKGMLEKLRERDETGVELREFVSYLEDMKRTSGTNPKEWNPADRSKERTVFRYIQQLTRLGCRIDYKNASKTFVLQSRDWRFPEETPWSLSSNAIQKVGEEIRKHINLSSLPPTSFYRIVEKMKWGNDCDWSRITSGSEWCNILRNYPGLSPFCNWSLFYVIKYPSYIVFFPVRDRKQGYVSFMQF